MNKGKSKTNDRQNTTQKT